MSTARGVAAVAVVALVVLAGCSGLGGLGGTGGTPADGTDATSTPHRSATPTPEPDAEIPVRGEASLPFDVNRTFDLTAALVGAEDVEPPSQVYVYRAEGYEPVVADPFARTLADVRSHSSFDPPRERGVVIGLTGQSRLELQFTLVHEFVHHLQDERVGDSPAVRRTRAADHDRRRAAVAVVEGAASYVAVEYLLRHTDHTRAEILAAADRYPNATATTRFVAAPYHFGRKYVAARVDSPADHWSVYRDPPRTTAELLHEGDAGQPDRPSVAVSADEWTVLNRDTRGELFARSVLAAELPEQRAAAGAAGWAGDTLVRMASGADPGFAWASKWNSGAEAGEFLSAFRAAMDRRAETTGDDRWATELWTVRVVRVAPDTVVVLSGPESFVTGATVGGESGRVTVEAP